MNAHRRARHDSPDSPDAPGLPAPSFEFFGGKGGVGKTTCAAARAVAAAGDGRRVLVVSTDPAHSLGDALGVKLSRGRGYFFVRAKETNPPPLFAVELDAPRAFARWLRDHQQALGDILEHGTWLDRNDVDALLALPIPGVDELIGMLEIVRLAGADEDRAAAYDLIVVDTAPTGHTLRLLAAPETVGAVSDVLDDLQQEHRVIRQQLARVGRPEAADRLIELLANQARSMGELLRDRERTAFHWVMAPEDLPLAETADALDALARARLPVASVIINRVVPDGPPCPICDRRRAEEGRILARAAATFGKRHTVRVVFEDPREPRGIPRLEAIGRQLEASDRGVRMVRSSGRARARLQTSGTGTSTAPLLDTLAGARLIFFGGKGGVGKTTTAAATALAIARRSRDDRVLLLSTDPAHSLGDVLNATVADAASTIRGAPTNLYVRELDAAAALTARRAGLEAALDEIVEALGAAAGARSVSDLLDLAPPGIDELFGVLSVVEAQERYQRIIVDTAPTGHALRLLETPEAARQWVQVLLRVLLKYRDFVRPGQLASELVNLSKAVRQLQELLHDAGQSRFVVVTRAAEVPRLETERLLARLRQLRLSTPAVIVNARTLAPGKCPRCRARASSERRELAAIRRACRRRSRDCVIIQAPLAAPPPRGVAALERWAGTWMGSGVQAPGFRRQASGSVRKRHAARKPNVQSRKPRA